MIQFSQRVPSGRLAVAETCNLGCGITKTDAVCCLNPDIDRGYL
jgi:hypothetical protein